MSNLAARLEGRIDLDGIPICQSGEYLETIPYLSVNPNGNVMLWYLPNASTLWNPDIPIQEQIVSLTANPPVWSRERIAVKMDRLTQNGDPYPSLCTMGSGIELVGLRFLEIQRVDSGPLRVTAELLPKAIDEIRALVTEAWQICDECREPLPVDLQPNPWVGKTIKLSFAGPVGSAVSIFDDAGDERLLHIQEFTVTMDWQNTGARIQFKALVPKIVDGKWCGYLRHPGCEEDRLA